MTNIGCCKKLIRFLTFIKLSTYISLFRSFHIPTFKHKPLISEECIVVYANKFFLKMHVSNDILKESYILLLPFHFIQRKRKE